MPNKCGTRQNMATTNKSPGTDCGNLRITIAEQIVEIIILMMEKSGLKATRQSCWQGLCFIFEKEKKVTEKSINFTHVCVFVCS